MLSRILLAFCTLTGLSLFGGEGEKVSLPAPDVTGINQDGKTVSFKEVYAKGPTVVFFYPKANTPGCTKQACSLRDAFADLSKDGVQVLGVLPRPHAKGDFRVRRAPLVSARVLPRLAASIVTPKGRP